MVYERWMALLRIVVIADDPVSLTHKRRRFVLVNALLVAFFFMTAVRFNAFSGSNQRLPQHILGNTMVNSGNVNYMYMMLACVCLIQMCMLRCICCRSLHQHDDRLEQVLKQMSAEKDERLRRQKEQVAIIVYYGCLLSSIGFFVFASVFVSGLLFLNWHSSRSWSTSSCWIFWWIQDLIVIMVVGITYVPVLATWLLLVLDYGINMDKVLEFVRHRTSVATSRVSQVIQQLDWLHQEAKLLHRSAAAIMFVVNLCTTPVVCLMLFSTVFGNIAILRIMMLPAAAAVLVIPIGLQAVAGHVTSKAE